VIQYVKLLTEHFAAFQLETMLTFLDGIWEMHL